MRRLRQVGMAAAPAVLGTAAAGVLPMRHGGPTMGDPYGGPPAYGSDGWGRAMGLYPPESRMMSNPAEFFAVTASCYHNGTVARDPFTRAAFRERQPDDYADLARIFGPRGEAAAKPAPTDVADAR